jgi:hypothetical protein
VLTVSSPQQFLSDFDVERSQVNKTFHDRWKISWPDIIEPALSLIKLDGIVNTGIEDKILKN